MKIFEKSSCASSKLQQLLLAHYFHDESLIIRDRSIKFLPGPSGQNEEEDFVQSTIHAVKSVPGNWSV